LCSEAMKPSSVWRVVLIFNPCRFSEAWSPSAAAAAAVAAAVSAPRVSGFARVSVFADRAYAAFAPVAFCAVPYAGVVVRWRAAVPSASVPAAGFLRGACAPGPLPIR
jgi:hypothetical protein